MIHEGRPERLLTTYLTTYRPGSPGLPRKRRPPRPADLNTRRRRPVRPDASPCNLPFPTSVRQVRWQRGRESAVSARFASTASAAALTTLVTALVCACGSAAPTRGASDPSSADAPSSSASGTAGTALPGAADASAGSAPSGRVPALHTGTATAPPSSAAARPSASGSLAAPGTYTYTASGSSPGSDTVAISNQPSGSTVDEKATVTDKGNQETSDDTWSSASVLLNDVKTTTAQGSADCHFSAPIIELQFPLATNASWHSDATCAVSQGAISGTLHWTETDTVSGTTSVTIDGTAVACWTITRTITVALQGAQGPSPQSQTSNITEVDAYAPSIGLPARTTTTSSSSSRTLTLQHLHPA